MKTAYIATNGCTGAETQVRQYADSFSRQGYVLTANPQDADLVVLDLCSFTQLAQEESLRFVESIDGQRKPSSKLMVTGCYLGVNPGRMEELFPHAEVLTKEELRQRCGNTINSPVVPGYIDTEGVLKLKIEDGCGGKCTFCAIPNGVGRRYSYPLDLVISTITDYVRERPGAAVKFVGEDIGFYGLDQKNETNITTLLKTVMDLPGDFSVRVDVLNPWWFLRFKDLTSVLAQGVDGGRIVPYLGIPLQSGSDSILRSMKRLYTRAQFEKIVDVLSDSIPHMGFSSEVIVGFPGETEDDFKQTFEVVEKYDFNPLGVWGYTNFQGTESHTFTGQIDEDIIKKRMEMLIGLVITKEQQKQNCATLDELCVRLQTSGQRLPLNTNANNKHLFQITQMEV